MSEEKQAKAKSSAVQTTGHAWDGDIQEFNNPLPRWWLWSFYATVVFALVYWFFYPTWPVGDTYTKGNSTITYKLGSEQVTTHWNSRALLMRELQQGEGALKQKAHMIKLLNTDYKDIVADVNMMQFTRSVGKTLFADNCAACHGAGGAGVATLFPNLADDDWLWGGTLEQIQETIDKGRTGFMPAFKKALNEDQMNALVEYVLSLSGHQVNAAESKKGEVIFNGEVGGCYYCHNKEATGMVSLGSANLTDSIWTVADVTQNQNADVNRANIRKVISDGVKRSMPGWQARLSEAEIKVLSVYVHELGGGK